MDNIIVAIVVGGANVALLAGVGWPLAGRMAALGGGAQWKWFLSLTGVYVAECFAFSASMGLSVLSVPLAAVWGFLFGRWLRGKSEDLNKTARRLAFYTCLPTISFACVLPLVAISGWDVFAREDGYRFGVPEFVPWPFCTIAGFFAAAVLVPVIVKMVVTTAIAVWRAKKNAGGR